MTLGRDYAKYVIPTKILKGNEVIYLMSFYSAGIKPKEVIPFNPERRTAYFQWLKFPANDVVKLYHGKSSLPCNVLFKIDSCADSDIEISELKFCQPPGCEGINSVQLKDTVADSVIKIENETFKGWPVYQATFEQAIKFSPTKGVYGQYGRLLKIFFKNKHGNWLENVAFLTTTQSGTCEPFTLSGKPIAISFGYPNDPRFSRYCLLALKMKYVN